jgi:hypothetical protein
MKTKEGQWIREIGTLNKRIGCRSNKDYKEYDDKKRIKSEIGTLNKRIGCRSNQEYKVDNKEKIKREQNKEKIKKDKKDNNEKIKCEEIERERKRKTTRIFLILER